MSFRTFFLVLIALSIFIVTGCVNGKSNTEVEENHSNIREIAWNFLKERGWHESAKEEWESSTVTKTVINEDSVLLDESYEGKEVWSVTFEDKENAVVGTPIVLVDAKTNKVIGYMPGE